MLFYTNWSEEGITGKATLEQVRPGRGEEVSHTLHEERMSQAEGTADAKALRWECLRISRKQPAWLERSDKGEALEIREIGGAGTRPVGYYRILEGLGLFSNWDGAKGFEQSNDII